MIKIGIIDSGIKPIYSETVRDIQGVFLKKDELTNEICSLDNIDDKIGHGSECFKIISSIVSEGSYYIVKVFDEEMVTDIDVFAQAIQICINQEVNIINISAGVKSEEIPELLRVVCDNAYDKNIIIVSAKHNSGSQCYPAHYKKVIGVGTADLTEGELYKYTYDDDFEFYTSAADLYPEHITWSDSTSFACAKMTAYAANILKTKGHMEINQMRDELIHLIRTK
ncbi:S8 family serine peptidase [Pedobacter antarcticus]|uniref:S8 family serine peptidase n=1 Tax=Pedobacter antarcticus TaxID=34086 RepID=UPI002931028B|nr:S8 family serine peptidase [Pedobacter antarcticus]